MTGYIPHLFPYTPRKTQPEIMAPVKKCLDRGKHVVYQASTGSGKTICTLAPVLEFASREEKRVVYLTRTNSQQKQVIRELRNMGGFYGMGMQGRNNTCLLALNDQELAKGDADELSKYCCDRKKEVIGQIGEGRKNYSCPYYAGLLRCDLDEMREQVRRDVPTVDEFLATCGERGLCAYELSKILARDAMLVTAPYVYFFVPFIRRRLLEWMEVEMGDLIVIVDEAHNLPDYARELASAELRTVTLERAAGESDEFGDPHIDETLSIKGLIGLLKAILLDTVDEFVVDEDGLIPPNQVRSELLHALGMNSNQLRGVIKDLKLQGEIVQQRRRDEKKLPRSYIHAVAEFLSFWISMDRAEYIKLVNGGANPGLEGYCLDPARVTESLNYCYASIHQSGTLEPLDEYRDSIGLPFDTELKKFPSPFPGENKTTLYIRGVATQYEAINRDRTMTGKLRSCLRDMVANVDRNTIVFFPSYKLLDDIGIPAVNGTGNVYVEAQGMSQPDLMGMVEEFKERGGVLLSVIGGRISEGMDFPGKELEVAVVVGIPYPKPTAKQRGLQHYYDLKFGKGWDYTVKAPAVRKILQATGRLVRSEVDLGAAVIVDERAVHFKSYLGDLRLVEDPGRVVNEFFDIRGTSDV